LPISSGSEAHGLDWCSGQLRDYVLVTFTLFVEGGIEGNPLQAWRLRPLGWAIADSIYAETRTVHFSAPVSGAGDAMI